MSLRLAANSIKVNTTYPEMMGEPSFAIPVHPERTFPFSGGVTYEGETTFVLVPESEWSTDRLAGLVESVLADGPYRYGDFFSLPMPLYLVKDDQTGDVFRLSVRDGSIRLHVLPSTESAGLRALYDRLIERSDGGWTVDCRSTPAA
jgi:hypothetical protein